MPEVVTEDATLYVEVDGAGEPVTVVAHGLTNNRRELAAFTPFLPGTAVRFDFRGHGRSSAPPEGAYAFADFARDVEAVADAYGATNAIGTSLGAGALASLVCRRPDRFERMVWLLPAALDLPFPFIERYRELAGRIEEHRTADELLDAIVSDPGRVQQYVHTPWKLEVDRTMWQHEHPEGLARAVRGVIADWPVKDRALLARVRTPTMLICIEGDEIHPAELGRIYERLLPNAELVVFESEQELFARIPEIVQRVARSLAGDG